MKGRARFSWSVWTPLIRGLVLRGHSYFGVELDSEESSIAWRRKWIMDEDILGRELPWIGEAGCTGSSYALAI